MQYSDVPRFPMTPILTIAGARDLVVQSRQQGKRVVTTNGVFDILSVPHLRMLEAAAREGDVLIVGINSDMSVRSFKGDKRPLVPEQQRAELVAGLWCVDGVFLFDELDPRVWLRTIKPHVHVNSAEYTEHCVEASVLQDIGARLVLVPRDTEHLSTSDIIRVVSDRYCP